MSSRHLCRFYRGKFHDNLFASMQLVCSGLPRKRLFHSAIVSDNQQSRSGGFPIYVIEIGVFVMAAGTLVMALKMGRMEEL